jgi:hypothetical protein
MKHLSVPFLPTITKESSLPDISQELNRIAPHMLEYSPWFRNPGTPEVSFSIGHGIDCIFLKYYVTEQNTRAVYSKPNDPVYKDSCVEIFISFDGDERYYNFEFNFLGNALVEFGPGRGSRTLLPASLIRKIKTQTVITSLQEEQEGMVHWELTVVVPFELFLHHTITSLKGQAGRVNFHKCGDDLAEPHFLIWNNIQSESPDFHLPRFFGSVKFESDEVTT